METQELRGRLAIIEQNQRALSSAMQVLTEHMLELNAYITGLGEEIQNDETTNESKKIPSKQEDDKNEEKRTIRIKRRTE